MIETQATAQVETKPDAFSPAGDLERAFWKLKQSRIRVSPCHATRASSIGHPCDRFNWYERTANEMRTLPSPELQCIFDLGNVVESYVLRELEAAGVEIVQRGRDYEDRGLELTGHVDAKLRFPGWPRAVPAEVKGLNGFTAESIRTIGDIRDHRQAWVRKYYAQLQTYLYLDKSDLGVYVLFSKQTGQIRFIDCPLDPLFAESMLEKAARLKLAVAQNEPPPRHQTSECSRCDFVHVCLPDQAFGPGVQILDSAEAQALLERREQLAEAHKEYERADKELKALLPEVEGEFLVGDFAVISKEVPRRGFTVAPTKYIKREFRRITKGDAQ